MKHIKEIRVMPSKKQVVGFWSLFIGPFIGLALVALIINNTMARPNPLKPAVDPNEKHLYRVTVDAYLSFGKLKMYAKATPDGLNLDHPLSPTTLTQVGLWLAAHEATPAPEDEHGPELALAEHAGAK
jgi:hypothetical protein